MVEIKKNTGTDLWLPRKMRLCTYPIMKQPAQKKQDIIGSTFLLEYKGWPYFVTAAHVIDIESPVIAIPRTDRNNVGINNEDFEKMNVKWILSKEGHDIAAIPCRIPRNKRELMEKEIILEDYWNKPFGTSTDSTVAHLGYPLQDTAGYEDTGQPAIFPLGMPGNIMEIDKNKIIMRTAGAHGASGGPVFQKREGNIPLLIGVTIKTRVIGHPEIGQGEYRNITTAIMIKELVSVLESEEMKKQQGYTY